MENPLGRARQTASQPLRMANFTSVKGSGVAQQQLSAALQSQSGQKKKRKAMQQALAQGPSQTGGW